VAFYDGLLPRLAALPGVRSAAAGYPLPLAEGSLGISFAIEGRPTTPGGAPSEVMAVATPGFFHTMGIPVLAGREFDARDNKQGRPVIVVNQRFARKYFPGESALGKHVRSDVSDGDAPPPMREIVGVVGDVHRKKLMAEPEPMYYLPFAQLVITSPALCLRAAGDPEQLAGALREEVARLNPEIPVFRVRSMDSLVSNAASEPRFQVVLVTSFALLAMVLSAVGLYAVLSYMVVRRTMEIGLRMALGAAWGDVLRWVLRRGLAMAALGVAIGLAASVAVTRYLQQLLFGVKPLDVLTLAVVSAVLLVVAALASGLPALRAARLDPLQALRQQ